MQGYPLQAVYTCIVSRDVHTNWWYVLAGNNKITLPNQVPRKHLIANLEDTFVYNKNLPVL